MNLFPEKYRALMRETGVIAVLVIDDAKDAVGLAKALLAGGIKIMELTLRTPAALEAITSITAEVPEMLVGAGTVLEVTQLLETQRRGASFAVSPGTNRRIIEKAIERGIPFGPGVATPSDIETALEYDLRLLKFFPAEVQGGLNYLKAMSAPYAHLGLEFIPLGGLSENNCVSYLAEKSVIAVGGSWIAPREEIKTGQWDKITTRAREAIKRCVR